ncbi:MAG: hypothetical protein IRZ03_12160 [Acidobacterium ailaaui]|nr:hypothetical protein [Pseudacidobacterium ailaaui]
MADTQRVRGTQSLVHTFAGCWRRPSLLLWELAWRWLFGIPALALVGFQAWRIYSATSSQLETTGIFQFSLQDPMRAAVMIADAFAVLWPPVFHVLLWLAPVLAVGWAIASGIGRNLVLRCYDPLLPKRPASLMLLQLLRIIALVGTFAGWFAAVHWAAGYALSGAEPSLVLYFALVICLSLGIFTLWALLSWVFSIAPLLLLLEDCSIVSSLLHGLRLGPLTGKLVEVNLVMGIIKLALIVLAMVMSASPLPFATVMQGTELYIWWAIVSLLYFAASDFFQVARLVAFIQLWRLSVPSDATSSPTPAASK